MTENLKNNVSQLIEKYIDILKQNGEPNELYKYLAINTFQQNWDLEKKDFYQMFRSSFSKVTNLLYQNSLGFIEKAAQNFPDETRAMFRNLYEDSVDVSDRIKTFQAESEKLLPKVRQALNRTNINTQQDERTISVYLAFRYPEKHILYKAAYYKKICEQLNIKPKKTGECFLHLQQLSNQIIKEGLLDENFINTYRKFYPKPDWEDKHLMIQNVLYVTLISYSAEIESLKIRSKTNNSMGSKINIPLNQILFGAPGTGKTYNTKRIAVEIIKGNKLRTREEINAEYQSLVNAKQIVFTTFHQSLSYEDFIEGIKPETIDGNVTYEVKDGIFKQLCRNANLQETTDNTKIYVLIIDEINRGNVSAIFGELITLLEEDKRKGNKEQTEVILPYSNDNFSVPNNIYIIGTMNTADRSVEALDTALRRRFSFIEMQPNPDILLDSEYQDVDLRQLLKIINQRIEVLIDKDHQIGHSYFIGIKNLEDLKQAFKDKIVPLLEEYFYGNFQKIGLVLGGSFIYQEENTAKFPKNFTYDNDFLEDKKVYRFTPFESWDESTFASVYED